MVRFVSHLTVRLTLPATEDEDVALPLPAVPTSRPGDLWLLGEHRLLWGSATRPEAIGRVG